MKLTNSDVFKVAANTLAKIVEENKEGTIRVYGIPRGGVPVAYCLAALSPRILVVSDPQSANIIVDDVIDSGATLNRWRLSFPHKKFYALFNKRLMRFGDKQPSWIVFPWESNEVASATDICTRLLQYIGEDVDRPGLIETPKRFLAAWQKKTIGYKLDPRAVMKVFEDGAEDYDEMIVVKDIEIESVCEHHLERIWGVAHVGYIPNGKIVGLSKLYRVANVFARRLQVQERLTSQIACAIMEELDPLGVGVVLECRHACMETRGICKRGQTTITSSLRGVFKEDAKVRAEFLSLANTEKAL